MAGAVGAETMILLLLGCGGVGGGGDVVMVAGEHRARGVELCPRGEKLLVLISSVDARGRCGGGGAHHVCVVVVEGRGGLMMSSFGGFLHPGSGEDSDDDRGPGLFVEH